LAGGTEQPDPAIAAIDRGAAQVRKQRDALAWLRGQVGSIFIDRPPVEAIHGMVLESEGIDEYLDVDEPFRTILIDRAIDEAYEKRKKFGLE
jgi:hypothetical protein